MHHGKKGSKAKAEEAQMTQGGEATRAQDKGYMIIAIVYLLGIFIGALDMGIVNPARTVIQNTLGVEDQLGVWVMTIYTLAYAASIPVMGKLADKYGRKYIYLICIVLFGVGSLFCGLAQDFASFEMLIVARAVQALGGGGIVPIATAEFGTAFPVEKRGMALGLVGGVYGIASVFGASAGSAILDIFGHDNWQFIFYINVPICLFVMLAGFSKLPNSKSDDVKSIDGLGICVMTVMVLSLMYGLKNIDFFNIATSITSTDVYPFLLAFIVLLPIFVFIENRAADPVMNLSYFKDLDIVVTLICSIFTGVIMMATLFLPQFSENALFMQSGSGGYLFIILGLFAGLGSPMSGKLIDKFGVKPVLGFGFLASAAGALFMAFVACNIPNLLTVIVTLALIGLGMGFTMGTPLNYMMLQKTDERESNSALATLSLVRSIGTAVAPAIMVAFVAHAGAGMQANIMNVLPTQVTVSPLPYAQELDEELAAMRADENYADMLEGLDIPELSSYTTIDVNMEDSENSDVTLSDEMQEALMSSDVTTIVDIVKDMVDEMFAQIAPDLEATAVGGIQAGIDSMEDALNDLDDVLAQMPAGMPAAVAMQEAHDEIADTVDMLEAVEEAIPGMFVEAEENYLAEIDAHAEDIQLVYQETLNEGFSGMFILVAVCSFIGTALLMLYRGAKKEE